MKKSLDKSIVILLPMFVRKYFYPREEYETQQVARIQKIQIGILSVLEKDVFGIDAGDERQAITDICTVEKSVSVEI